MARKLQQEVSDDDSSQKENKYLASKAKTGKAAGKRRADDPPADEPDLQPEDEDAEGSVVDDEDEKDDDDRQGSPKGRKRVRVNEQGDGRSAKEEPNKGKGKARAETLVRDVDGFVPGSIVRVKLKNFVTYDHVEFRPGPHLNMIIGPNGTGKSSIACAIALGLNWSPTILGRANELNAFVKMGTTDGFIEIELKGKIGKPNVVIRRNLSATSKTSTFTVNGRSATGREVTQKMNELNIQIGNLCSFLPQDKVSEFAHMSPQQLLKETQHAAGDGRLTAWHETLIKEGKDWKEMGEALAADRKQLDTLKERNAMLERDVQRFNERKEIERQIDLLELMIPFMEYIEARQRYVDAKAKQRELFQRVQVLKKKNAPTLEFKKRLETQYKRLEEQRNEKKKFVTRKFKALSSKWDENEKLEGDAEEITSKLDNLKKEEKSRVQKMSNLEKDIDNIQKQLEKPVKVEKMEDIQEELRNVNAESSAIAPRQLDLQERQARNVEEESKARNEVNAGRTALKEIENVASRKLNELAKNDADIAAAVRWLRNNQHRFQQEIIEPPILSVTVPNRSFVHAVEGCFNYNQLRTFVAQNDADYRLFTKLVCDTPEALGRKVRLTSLFVRENARINEPPMTEEQLHALGFDGYAIDYIDCPEPLRRFLTVNCDLHRTAIALNPNKVDGNKAMEVISRTNGATYIAGNTTNKVTRSRYGQQLAQNMTGELRGARFFVGPTIDQSKVQEIQQRIADAEYRLSQCQDESKALGEEEKEIKKAYADCKKRHDAIVARKNKIGEEKKRLASLQNKLQMNQNRLADLRVAPPLDAERARLKEKLINVTRKRIAIAQQYAEQMRVVMKEQAESTQIGLRYLQVGSNKTALDAMIKERDAEYDAAVNAFQEANTVYDKAKADSKKKLDRSKAKLDEVDDELRDTFKQMEASGTAEERDVEELETELETQRSKLDLVIATNPGVIDQYERRKAEIETLSKKIEERERKAAKVEKTIKQARDNWQPAVEELVGAIGEKFSAAFDRIGCAGEVELTPHEDYDKWAITIKVKFRDSEQLQQLTAHRQSGGERSLTTILYLMSMTEQARAPFSLVDEINQGMDQRAERTVHNELVKTTCKEDSGQYFLITPKLLPDLQYHRLMKVLCVNNGEWLPEDSTGAGGNMMSMIKTYLQKRGQQ